MIQYLNESPFISTKSIRNVQTFTKTHIISLNAPICFTKRTQHLSSETNQIPVAREHSTHKLAALSSSVLTSRFFASAIANGIELVSIIFYFETVNCA